MYSMLQLLASREWADIQYITESDVTASREWADIGALSQLTSSHYQLVHRVYVYTCTYNMYIHVHTCTCTCTCA